MSWLTIMHEGSTMRNMTKQERELKLYADTEGLSWWTLLKGKRKKKK